MWLNDRLPRISISHRGWLFFSILGVTLLLFWRRPDAFTNPQLWAEDGSRFFTNAFFLGPKSITLAFGGYLHIVARIVAWAGNGLPVQFVPHWYTLASWMMLAGLIATIFNCRIPGTTPQKVLMALALAATTADNEVFFNLANWPFITPLFWLLLAIADEPESRLERIVDYALLLVAGLNTPFVLCLWLLFLLRWRWRRTDHSLHLLVLAVVVVLLQAWNLPDRLSKSSSAFTLDPMLIDVLVYRFGFMFFGEPFDKIQLNILLRVAGLLAIGGGYGSLIRSAWRQKNLTVLTVLGTGILTTIISLYVMKHDLAYLAHWAGRHYYLPAVTLVWALILSHFRVKFYQWAPLALTCIAFLFLTPSSKMQIRPDLHWAEEVARCTGTQPLCKIPINPVWDPPAWFARMNSHLFTQPEAQYKLQAHFGDAIELIGYGWEQINSELRVQLVWKSLGRMEKEYAFFIHIYSEAEPPRLQMQSDQMPLDWSYPTTKWVANEFVEDSILLTLADLPPGTYQISVGWYDPASSPMTRLAAIGKGLTIVDNRLILPTPLVIPEDGP